MQRVSGRALPRSGGSGLGGPGGEGMGVRDELLNKLLYRLTRIWGQSKIRISASESWIASDPAQRLGPGDRLRIGCHWWRVRHRIGTAPGATFEIVSCDDSAHVQRLHAPTSRDSELWRLEKGDESIPCRWRDVLHLPVMPDGHSERKD